MMEILWHWLQAVNALSTGRCSVPRSLGVYQAFMRSLVGIAWYHQQAVCDDRYELLKLFPNGDCPISSVWVRLYDADVVLQ